MLLRSLSLLVVILTAAAPQAFAQLIQADFETGLAPLAAPAMEPPGITRTVSGGTVRVESTTTGTLTPDTTTTYADFAMAVEVVDWAGGLGQLAGLSNLAFNGTGLDGFAVVLDFDNDTLVLQRIATDIPTDEDSAATAVALSSANDYRVVMVRLFTVTDVTVLGSVYDVAEPTSPLASVSHTETQSPTYISGYPGIVTDNGGMGTATDATFDDFVASDNLASTDADGWTDIQEIERGTDPSDDLDFPFVDMAWVAVEGGGNACDTQSQGCFGTVVGTYRIGTYEVTNAQYQTFLNAAAATDTHGLYSASMAHPFYGGITRAGTSGSFTYATQLGRADNPVTFVSWYNAVRFANWLHNGQQTGAQDATTTEDGAYTFTGTTTVGARNAGAKVFLPSEDQWYKAAYYDVGTSSYFDFPAGSDTQTTCASPTALANHGNCLGGPIVPTEVGSYTGSASPNGTFDQGGNVWEWLEDLAPFSKRLIRGGGFGDADFVLAAAERVEVDPVAQLFSSVGFRVASVAPPTLPSLAPVGLALLASMLGITAYRIKKLDHE